MSTASCFYLTASIVTQSVEGHPMINALDMRTTSPLSDSKSLLQDPLHTQLLAVGVDLSIHHKRPSLALTSLFTRSSTRTLQDAYTSSTSTSSESPTSSFLLDDDPFAMIHSPSPIPSPKSADPRRRPPLAPRQSVLQCISSRAQHSHATQPGLVRKRVRYSPSLPSLRDLARADASSYASVIARTRASKRFPLEPWNLHDTAKWDENSGLQSQIECLKDENACDESVVGTGAVSVSTRSRKARLNSELELCVNKNYALPRSIEVGLQHVDALHPKSPDGFSWWDLVHDSKDAVECEGEEGHNQPERQPGERTICPLILEATLRQGNGHRPSVDHGGQGRDNDVSSGSSDSYGSDGPKGGDYGGGGASGRGHDDGDDNDFGPGRSVFSDTDDDSESESEGSEDSEDDIPLAQRIPGALQAQKSIQNKDKAERERRRRERQTQKHRSVKTPSNQIPTATPLAVDDLTKRLLKVQAPERHSPSSSSKQHELASAIVQHRPVVAPLPAYQPQLTPRQTNSLHPPAANMPTSRQRQASLEESKMQYNPKEEIDMRYPRETKSTPVSRNQTIISRSRKSSTSQFPPRNVSPSQARSASQPSSQGGTTIHRRGPSSAIGVQPETSTQINFPSQEPFPSQPSAGQRRGRVSQESGRRDAFQGHDGVAGRSRTLSSAAAPGPRVLQRARTASNAVLALPPMPPTPMEVKFQPRDPNSTQLRVFIGDMQRFNTVEIGPQTRAKDVLDIVQAQGELCGEAAAQLGGWMVWELAQDFGMERPLREYELLAETYASWNSNTRLNAFMIKKTPLAGTLARQAMPSSSPRYSGYVQWESKRGKWNKRWMELKEHSIWLSKREDRKDETFLCSLSNFDGYYVSRKHKAPKSFIFAVKSTDNLTLFENPADYLHVFSCDERDGQRWIERILLARSYVLLKERTVLFSTPINSPPAIPSASSAISRRAPSLSRSAAPLVNVTVLQSPAASFSTQRQPFLPGSLLARTSA